PTGRFSASRGSRSSCSAPVIRSTRRRTGSSSSRDCTASETSRVSRPRPARLQRLDALDLAGAVGYRVRLLRVDAEDRVVRRDPPQLLARRIRADIAEELADLPFPTP